MSAEPKCYCSSTLIVLGDDLDPKIVTNCLRIEPTRSFRKGEKPSFVKPDGSVRRLDIPYKWGSWKRRIEEEKRVLDISDQLQYWCNFLDKQPDAIRELKSHDYSVLLDCFI